LRPLLTSRQNLSPTNHQRPKQHVPYNRCERRAANSAREYPQDNQSNPINTVHFQGLTTYRHVTDAIISIAHMDIQLPSKKPPDLPNHPVLRPVKPSIQSA